jgi:hypothetical protein
MNPTIGHGIAVAVVVVSILNATITTISSTPLYSHATLIE